MALRYALVGLLASRPSTGYELTKRFAASMAHVWPAGHSQIYPELARLVADGLIEQTGEGPRGSKTYAATPGGVDALTDWMRTSEPDYGVRSDAQLRDFFLWTLPDDEAIAHIERDVAVYRQRLADLEELECAMDWTTDPPTRAGRLTLEKGLRYYRMLVDWSEWAMAQIDRGALGGGSSPSSSATNRGAPGSDP
jgi:DNA-binding PadR family transcriptional regulator